jgi:hypothetical protein
MGRIFAAQLIDETFTQLNPTRSARSGVSNVRATNEAFWRCGGKEGAHENLLSNERRGSVGAGGRDTGPLHLAPPILLHRGVWRLQAPSAI